MSDASSTTAITTAEERAFRRLQSSTLYQNYQAAFHLATGLFLDLCSADEDRRMDSCIRNGNPFCQLLNRNGGCSQCALTHGSLLDTACDHSKTTACFAKLQETAIPIKAGNSLVAFLRIGQVFERPPSRTDFEEVAQILRKSGYRSQKMQELKEAYLQSIVIEPERYNAAVTLLETFALHLTEELSRLLVTETNQEPPVIRRAKQYLNAHLEEKITLDDVANHAHISAFYLCKLFKQATGMTITEYINRRRVEWAKRKLLNPHMRITEVAYEVGYQSLSQFNRSFLKYAGQSPSEFRSQQGQRKATAAA